MQESIFNIIVAIAVIAYATYVQNKTGTNMTPIYSYCFYHIITQIQKVRTTFLKK